MSHRGELIKIIVVSQVDSILHLADGKDMRHFSVIFFIRKSKLQMIKNN